MFYPLMYSDGIFRLAGKRNSEKEQRSMCVFVFI
jgi:hypothetical protein